LLGNIWIEEVFMSAEGIKRREFIGGMAALSMVPAAGLAGADEVAKGGGAGLEAANLYGDAGRDVAKKGEMPYRMLGKTGAQVSCIGLGGYHLGTSRMTDAEMMNLFHAAVDRGINFSDNCWDYNGGESERRVGKALAGGYREKVFVMTKFDGRTKVAALKQLDESLQRLQVETIDLWQFHENIRLEDPDRFFAEGGAVEAVMEAKKAGKIKFVGFTGHKDPSVHLRMLEMADKHNFSFDAVQMPLNVMDAHFRSFGTEVLPVLVRKQIGVLGMKSLAAGIILRSNTASALECLQYALSLPTSVVITGIESMENLEQAFTAAKTYSALSKTDIDGILAKTLVAAGGGRYEPFKTGTNFDGTAHNPDWLG
jgi:aryl-alcohol dehydrogenase-like predicted oxidoreductase